MELRRILYGYQKEQFRFSIMPNEAKTVKEIFDRYILGDTLLQIANDLTKRQIVYYKDRSNWSKQAVRRIIENRHYCGDMEYPEIISCEQFQKANSLRLDKGGTREKDSEEITWLKNHSFCEQSGIKLTRRSHHGKAIGKWGYGCECKFDTYLDDAHYFKKIITVLNRVIVTPLLLRIEEHDLTYEPSLEIVREEKEINRMSEQSNLQFRAVKTAVFQNIANKYRCLKLNTADEYTKKLIEYFYELEPIENLDMTILKKTVNRIYVKQNGEIVIAFINGANIESEAENNGRIENSTFAENSNEN